MNLGFPITVGSGGGGGGSSVDSFGWYSLMGFGASGDGSDDSAAFQSAIDSGSAIYLPAGRVFRIQDVALSADQDVLIDGPGTLLVPANSNGLTIALPLGDLKTALSLTDISSSTEANPATVTQITSMGHGLVEGDVIKVIADKVYDDVRNISAVVGELAVVNRVVDANSFELNCKLEKIANGDSGVVFRRLSRSTVDVNVRVGLYGAQSTPHSGTPHCVRVANAINPTVRIRCDQSHQTVLSVDNCFGGDLSVVNNWADNDDATSVYGYGIRIGGGTSGAKASIVTGPCRHAVTSKDSDGVTYGTTEDKFSLVGRTRHVTIHDSTATGCTSAAFDTHGLSDSWTFSNCHAIYSGIHDRANGVLPVGFQIRGKNLRLVNCTSKGGRIAFNDVSALHQIGTWKTELIECDGLDNRLRALNIDQNGIDAADLHTVTVRGGTLEARSTAITAEDSILRVTGTRIRYTGFAYPVILSQTSAKMDAEFKDVLFDHASNNGFGSVYCQAGTIGLAVYDSKTSLIGDIAGGVVETSGTSTVTLSVRNWRQATSRAIRGLYSGGGSVTLQTDGEPINVLDFFSDRTGASSASPQVAAAISAAEDGSTVVFPKGTYDCSAGWTAPSLTKSLRFVGADATIIGPQTSGDASNFINLESGSSVTLWGLSFQYFHGVVKMQPNVAISHKTIHVEQCDFDGCYYAVYDGGGSGNNTTLDHLTFVRNKVHSASRAVRRGVVARFIDHGTVIVEKNRFYDIENNDIAAAIWIGDSSTAGGQSCNVSRNLIKGVHSTLNDTDSHGIFVHSAYCEITGNWIYNVTNANFGENSEGIYTKSSCPIVHGNTLQDAGSEAMIYIKGSPQSINEGGSVTSNKIRRVSGTLANIGGRGGYGIACNYPCMISDNDIDGTIAGVYLTNHSGSQVHNNRIRNLVDAGAIHGIRVDDCSDITVTENLLEVLTSSGGNSVYGIRVRRGTAGTSSGIVVARNRLLDSTTGSSGRAGVWIQCDSATEYLSDVRVEDNEFDDWFHGVRPFGTFANISGLLVRGNRGANLGTLLHADLASTTDIRYGHYKVGSGSPVGSVTPDGIHDEYLDTVAGAWYRSTGLTNADWQAL